ncbi:hypothetical protein [Streptomyces kronopolitis]|uniref:hypothetical protein n=1 Tax=Streptomyces kronopolitis TaxID=1612435 RepID=UPI003D99C3DE
MINWMMTSSWTGQQVRLPGIELDDWRGFMRFAADEERLGDLLATTGGKAPMAGEW